MRLALREAAASFINGHAPWTHLATFTYPCEPSVSTLERDYKGLLRLLSAIGGADHVPVAVAAEPQQRGVPHLHMLIAVPPAYQGNPAKQLRRHWFHATGGNAQVRRYDPSKRAGKYLVGHSSWDLDYACPRLGPCCRGACKLLGTPLSFT